MGEKSGFVIYTKSKSFKKKKIKVRVSYVLISVLCCV